MASLDSPKLRALEDRLNNATDVIRSHHEDIQRGLKKLKEIVCINCGHKQDDKNGGPTICIDKEKFLQQMRKHGFDTTRIRAELDSTKKDK